MLRLAENISFDFLRLRNKALLCVLRKAGKRRSGIPLLETEDVWIDQEARELVFRFTLLKKRKKKLLQKQSIKAIRLDDPLSVPILEYRNHLLEMEKIPRFFFPPVRPLFGKGYMIMNESHITGRQVFNVIRDLSSRVWPHLFRETAAADVCERDRSITAVFKVQDRLDLEDYRTAFNYVRRFARDVIEPTDFEWEEVTQSE